MSLNRGSPTNSQNHSFQTSKPKQQTVIRPMNKFLSSIPTHRIAHTLLLVLACAFISACAGPAYRHEGRVDRRGDRQDYRQDRRY